MRASRTPGATIGIAAEPAPLRQDPEGIAAPDGVCWQENLAAAKVTRRTRGNLGYAPSVRERGTVDDLVASCREDVGQMGPQCQLRDVVVCFLDIKKWRRGTHGKSPGEVFSILCDVYEKVLPIAEEHGGRLVKVMGDAALIVWETAEAPRAIAAVRRMRDEFRKLQDGLHPAEPMGISASLTLGPVMAGDMGPSSIRRFDVVGEPVNAAATMLRGRDFAITQKVADSAPDVDLTGIEIVRES